MVLVHENIPCRVSYYLGSSSIAKNKDESFQSVAKQSVKIFLTNQIEIKPGSQITISQNGYVKEYKNSGYPSVYSHHQEVILELHNSI